MPTGSTVAALTTSLPGTPGGERTGTTVTAGSGDSTFTLQALHWMSLDWEADEYMQFVGELRLNKDGHCRSCMGLTGVETSLESQRDDLTGYAGAGRSASATVHLDRGRMTLRCCLDSILPHTRRLIGAARALADSTGASGMRDKCLAPAGPGHLGSAGAPQHYVSSKLMCWVAMDRAAKLAEIRGDTELDDKWRAIADEIREDILTHGLKKGVLQHYLRQRRWMLRR